MSGITEEQDPIEAVARMGARLILQQTLEDEATEFIGRARHERAHDGREVIYRNGIAEPSTVRTTSGPTVIERPRVRDATRVGFESQVLGWAGGTQATARRSSARDRSSQLGSCS